MHKKRACLRALFVITESIRSGKRDSNLWSLSVMYQYVSAFFRLSGHSCVVLILRLVAFLMLNTKVLQIILIENLGLN